MLFYSLENPEDQVYQATASFLLQAASEAVLFSDQDLYSYREFEFNDFSDSKDPFYPYSESYSSNRARILESVKKFIYVKGNKEFKT